MRQSILVVDDDTHMLRLVEKIVHEKTLHRVVSTNNSLEVPKMLEEKNYDLILTDLRMPGMDGMDILRWTVDNQRFENVILMTAFGTLETAVEAMTHGVFDYIIKPFKKEEILFSIERAMLFQKTKRKYMNLSKICKIEKYEDALAAFNREYVHRLMEKFEDKDAAVKSSGIDPELMERFID